MSDREILINIYRDINQAMVDRDTEKLQKILKEDTLLVHMTGYQQPVSEWLDQIDSQEMKYYSWKEEAIKDIQINGDKASLIGQSRVKARIWGAGPSVWPLQIHMFFQKIDGRWQVIKQVASTY
ncbi:nuclear transport factor 2 family protein [Streptococcus loxodontisalivarius]|uniref:Ketosteroid isomerase-like protein n=1 Tax=Streptococcus loxodontisalivarius TaxID=1349415 RepID=A0ABS2PQF3_9STRE|nr:nuclear transport factor 2 family protein [Streptococcus loxodontisalivarius]MBM7642272.1 ketosteroid isomerase-like protein [Streptococcus loxodontisalivarius]